MVEHLATPSTARIGEILEATADVRSTVAQPATVRLYADGVQVAEKAVELQAGANVVTFFLGSVPLAGDQLYASYRYANPDDPNNSLAAAQVVEDGVEHLAGVGRRAAALGRAGLRPRQQRLEQPPLLFGQVGRVWFPAHT